VRERCTAGAVGVAEGKRLLDQAGYRFLDLRPADEYDREHLTKPPRRSVNVPCGGVAADAEAEAFAERVRGAKIAASQPVLVVCGDGSAGEAAAAALEERGWSQVVAVEGGYRAWRELFTTSGRKVPPKGRWVPTGKESLKSALNVGDAAMAYEERINVEDLNKKGEGE